MFAVSLLFFVSGRVRYTRERAQGAGPQTEPQQVGRLNLAVVKLWPTPPINAINQPMNAINQPMNNELTDKRN